MQQRKFDGHKREAQWSHQMTSKDPYLILAAKSQRVEIAQTFQ